MKTISVNVSESEYEAFRRAAASRNRSMNELVREAMALYRTEKIEERTRLMDLPVLQGHELVGPLPSRSDLYEEIFPTSDPEPA